MIKIFSYFTVNINNINELTKLRKPFLYLMPVISSHFSDLIFKHFFKETSAELSLLLIRFVPCSRLRDLFTYLQNVNKSLKKKNTYIFQPHFCCVCWELKMFQFPHLHCTHAHASFIYLFLCFAFALKMENTYTRTQKV